MNSVPKSRETVVIVSGALFSAEGKLLLLCRRDGEQWELPGGAIEFGEAPEPGLVRTFSEATDMDISTDRPLGAWSTVEQRGEAELHIIHFDYTVRCASAMTGVDLNRDIYSAFAWLPRAEALAKTHTPALKNSIERAFDSLARSRKNG